MDLKKNNLPDLSSKFNTDSTFDKTDLVKSISWNDNFWIFYEENAKAIWCIFFVCCFLIKFLKFLSSPDGKIFLELIEKEFEQYIQNIKNKSEMYTEVLRFKFQKLNWELDKIFEENPNITSYKDALNIKKKKIKILILASIKINLLKNFFHQIFV